MPHDFVIADVFTKVPFGGNQLAVFYDAEGLSERAMQAFAHELNFPESTFVLPSSDPKYACRLRIFTPKTELPFAGHPTIGTAAVLVHLGRAGAGSDRILFEEGIGPVPVEIEPAASPAFTRLVLEREVEEAPAKPSRSSAASALSLPDDAVLDTWAASAGIPFSFIHLADSETVDRASLDRAAWSKHFAQSWSPQLYLFSGDLAAGSRLYVRMFAPAIGIMEDPATGSGAVALAGALARRLPDRTGAFNWTIEQGVALGRPSTLEAAAEKRDGRTVKLSVGGNTIISGTGALSLPAGF
ncbi:MAG: PhzF family phenazine biosynthesis protein [Alphaproteobacteria bacterium]|nr:PhzF family phenazine biosynthesis protein [Alphaproteobacteria bacterium]